MYEERVQCIRKFTERQLKFPPSRPDQIARCRLLICSVTRAKTAELKYMCIPVCALHSQFLWCLVHPRLQQKLSLYTIYWITILGSSFLLQVTTAVLSITNKFKSRAKKSEASDEKMDVVRSLSYWDFVVRRFVFFTSCSSPCPSLLSSLDDTYRAFRTKLF